MVTAHPDWLVRKRDGRVAPFDSERIVRALTKAFRADQGLADGAALPESLRSEIEEMTNAVLREAEPSAATPEGVEVETIQDRVELELMRRGHYTVARRYIVYRAEHAKVRAIKDTAPLEDAARPRMYVTREDGTREPLDVAKIERTLTEACGGLETLCDADDLKHETLRGLFDGISKGEVLKALILAARSRIERDPAWDTVTSRLMLRVIYREALGEAAYNGRRETLYREKFERYLDDGIAADRLDPVLKTFDLDRLAKAIRPERDDLFQYLGLQAIYDRYLLHIDQRRIETPQYFWMRVAMGLALGEEDRDGRAIQFYDQLSSLRFTSATPTLFNSGTLRPQLSSCYLSTVQDDLENIFKLISDNAKLSKWAGGLGNDWTNIRATGAHIAGTNGQSQGVIPFLKVVNDTAVAVNQGGKRKGAVCAYLETWHLDLEEFLDLRKNTGDERRRTHDMHTANWIPDLFMKRVRAGSHWTMFSPDDVRDLHDLFGQEFEKRYQEYERAVDDGQITLFKRVPAVDLWRKMLTRVFETGHPWITWKDPSNVRSPQDHVGVVHSSNLCTEILLNTSETETAVCNLGSINLAWHIRDGKLDRALLAETVKTAVRMLDNVIDINYYPTAESRHSNLQHRPIGLGIMGFQDALSKLGLSYASRAAVEFADTSMEAISHAALLASSELAGERGRYPSFEGSKWDRGLLPIDTLDLLESERGCPIMVDRSVELDWEPVRRSIRQHGMRNSNVLAIAPTATISTIIGVSQSIEPHYKHLYVKSNLSGEFTQVNRDLVDDLKGRGLWDREMLDAIKYYDGTLTEIDRIPAEVKRLYLTAFEIDPKWIIECAARRQKWIDMGQSLNLYMAGPSGKKLHDMYFLAWDRGLKTTYYLRTLAATQVEKSTIDVNKFGIQPRWMKNRSASGDIQLQRGVAGTVESDPADPGLLAGPVAAQEGGGEQPATLVTGKSCNIDGTCEACQ